MHEIAKHEFLSWVDTLETEQLSEHEITMLSILISNFEEVASVGTASGQRAKLLSQKITELNKGTAKDLSDNTFSNINELAVKVFTKDRIGETDNNYLLIDIKMLARVAHKNGKL